MERRRLLEDEEDSDELDSAFTVRRTAPNPNADRETESLDYHDIHNDVHARRKKRDSWFTTRSLLG